MYRPVRTKRFQKDVELARKRGRPLKKLKKVIQCLLNGQSLPQNYRDHRLIGNYQGRRECHLEPDWLLIYKIEGEEMIFERTGSHSDLFR